MASLDRHTLTPRPEEHAKLAFRADCPYCRELRLRGALPSPELVPGRAKAGLLAGLVAAAGALPAGPALAQATPSAGDGEAAVLPPGGLEAEDGGRQGDSAAVGLGGAPERPGPPVTDPPPEIRPPQAPASQQADPPPAAAEPPGPTPSRAQAPTPEAQPPEPGPAPSGQSHGHEPGDDATPPVTPDRPLSPEPEHGSHPERQLDPRGSAADPPPPASAPPTSPASPVGKPDSAPAPERPGHQRQRDAERLAPSVGSPAGAAPRREPPSDSKPDRKTAGGAAEAKSSRVAGAVGAGSRSDPGSDQHDGEGSPERPETGAGAAPDDATAARAERVHEVQPGESLWAIAARRVGPRAIDAEIAVEVNRLWELNDTEVIRTGDPDLILPGQRLRL